MEEIPTTYDARERVWSGAQRVATYTDETSLGKIIFNIMKNWPKNVCQINDSDGVELTFEQAITWAVRIAQILKKNGLKHPDVIGITARNSTYVTPVAVACLLNGTPFHAVNPVSDEATLAHVFSITKPTVIFSDGLEYEKVRSATKGWEPQIFTVTDPIEGVPHIETLLDPTKTEMFYQPEPLKEGGEQTVAIMCSSGTTGLPKAVCISNQSLFLDFPGVNSELIVFSASGLDWYSGLTLFFLSTVLGCTRIITNKPFAPDYFVKLVEKYKINFVILLPHHMSVLIAFPGATKEALASIGTINYAGGFTSMTTLKKMQELCPNAMLSSGYGLTEVGRVAYNIGLGNVNTAGKPMPGIRIRIVDENGKSLGYNEQGEIFIHTGLHWNGYYSNPLETQRIQDHEGWVHTGDLGYFDDHNLLYVIDRKKEILKYQGNQYWPSEIEGVISELPQVEEVCVISIYDEQQGDAAGALVVKRKESSITAEEIAAHVAKRLPSIEKQLHAGVQFTDKLPANPNGKTLRRVAREEFVVKKGAGK
ncbi:4-coumarate--CoA ligase 1-like [Drosophila subpulchrella]|uniref:4-coumarate--CoA ligase 1-like n=1 Tax=Drosophila subpulchrella TaxID=1486046 RepID=UPI0018A179B5|nr:4-coumarate--CoA ligase 1-like [Drosophila subpulchrella]